MKSISKTEVVKANNTYTKYICQNPSLSCSPTLCQLPAQQGCILCWHTNILLSTDQQLLQGFTRHWHSTISRLYQTLACNYFKVVPDIGMQLFQGCTRHCTEICRIVKIYKPCSDRGNHRSFTSLASLIVTDVGVSVLFLL